MIDFVVTINKLKDHLKWLNIWLKMWWMDIQSMKGWYSNSHLIFKGIEIEFLIHWSLTIYSINKPYLACLVHFPSHSLPNSLIIHMIGISLNMFGRYICWQSASTSIKPHLGYLLKPFTWPILDIYVGSAASIG